MNSLLKSMIASISSMCILFTCGNVITSSADESVSSSVDVDSIYQSLSNEEITDLKAQGRCSTAYGEFLNELPNNYTPMFSAIEESAEYVYPEDYAGTYYNQYDDNKMTLYLTNFDNLNYYQTFFDSDICHFELVEYSYNDLTTLFDYLSYSMVELDLNTVSIDELNNCVKVGINEDMSNKDIIDYVESLGYDIGMVTFEYNVREETIVENVITDDIKIDLNNQTYTTSANTSYSANSGSIIFSYDEDLTNFTGTIVPNSWATIGYNAYNSSTNQYGIVTAGHFLSNNTDNYLYNEDGILINKNQNGCIYYNDSNVDAAFIPANSGNKLIPSLYIENYLTGDIYILQKEQSTLSPAMVNMTVYSFGVTTGMQKGTISDMTASFSVAESGITISNCIEVDFTIQPGDSGGPLAFYTIQDTPRMAVMGICKGYSYYGSTSYFVKVNTINKYLGVTMYSYDYTN